MLTTHSCREQSCSIKFLIKPLSSNFFPQLAEFERQADTLLTTLSNTPAADGDGGTTPHSIVTNAINALKGYEAAITKLQEPVLNSLQGGGASKSRFSPLPPAVLNTAWMKAHPNRTHNKQSRVLPMQQATTLEGLVATFHQSFEDKIKIEIFHLPEQQQRRLIVTFQGIFVAHILLETLEEVAKSSKSLEFLPIGVDITPAVSLPGGATAGATAATPPPLFIQQLKTAATIAVLGMKNKATEEVAPLEMLLLWLTLCAVRCKKERYYLHF
jgi:hypothetical protein